MSLISAYKVFFSVKTQKYNIKLINQINNKYNKNLKNH